MYLAEIVLDARHPLPVRQLAAVLLKQYVDHHWWKHEDKFRPPETTPAAKAAIRDLLPRGTASFFLRERRSDVDGAIDLFFFFTGLDDANSKIRLGVAHAISAVAHWDWPDEWPTLFDTMMVLLMRGGGDGLHGSMSVLLEVTLNVDEKQMHQVHPRLLPF